MEILNLKKKIRKQLSKAKLKEKITLRNLKIYSKGGIPLTINGENASNKEIFEGGLLAAISLSIENTYKEEISHMRAAGKSIIIKRSKKLLGCLLIESADNFKADQVGLGLGMILEEIENNASDEEIEGIKPMNIDYFLEDCLSTMS